MKYVSKERVAAAGQLMRTLWILLDHGGESMRSARARLFEHAYDFLFPAGMARPEPLERYEIFDFIGSLPTDKIDYPDQPSGEVSLTELDADDFILLLLNYSLREKMDSHDVRFLVLHGICRALNVTQRLKHLSKAELLEVSVEDLLFQAHCRKHPYARTNEL